MNRVIFGDCRDTLRDLKAQGVRVQCCVTSPPYYGLRQYDSDAVVIDPALPADKRAWLERELLNLGIHAR
jgi:hypothetical protein